MGVATAEAVTAEAESAGKWAEMGLKVARREATGSKVGAAVWRVAKDIGEVKVQRVGWPEASEGDTEEERVGVERGAAAKAVVGKAEGGMGRERHAS